MPMSEAEEKELRAKLAELSGKVGSLEGALKQKDSEISKANEVVQKARQYVVKLTSETAQALRAQQAQASEPDDDEDDSEDFSSKFQRDPEAALNAHFERRMAPLMAQTFGRDIRNAWHTVSKELAGMPYAGTGKSMLEVYGEELQSFMEPMPAETKADPDSWRQALQYVRSQHVDDEIAVIADMKAQEKMKESEIGGALVEAASSPSGESAAKKVRISGDEMKLAEEFGMSPQDWVAMGGGDDADHVGDTAVEEGE